MLTYDRELGELKKRGVRVEVLYTFEQLERIRDEFTIGHNGYKTPFVIVVGAHGSAKSHHFENAPNSKYINTAASPVGLYAEVFRCKMSVINARLPEDQDEGKADAVTVVPPLLAEDLAIILDDVDGLLQEKGCTGLLKALGNDRDIKLLSWHKQNTWLHSEGIPLSYETASRLCILCNEFPKVGRDLQAVFDRAKIVMFAPTAQEIHRYVGRQSNWILPTHEDIFEFIGANLQHITSPSIRWYTDPVREKRLGNVWKQWLLQAWHHEDPNLSIVADIRNNKARCPNFAAEVIEFNARTGLKAAMYKRYVARYKAAQDEGGRVQA